MARKLALKSIPFALANGSEVPPLSVGLTLMDMLRNSPPGRGLSYDEVVHAVEALAPIQKAVDEGLDEVTLTEVQWRTLCAKLDTFHFSFADAAIVEFGEMIRSAEEIT